MRDFRHIPRSILNSYAGVLFLSHPGAGLLILLLTLIYPNLGFSALACALAAYGFARILGLKEEFLRLDFYIYNPLLVGLSIGYYFKLCLLSLVFLVLMGIFTFVLTYTLYSLFSYYLRLPILSLPFVLGSLLAALAAYQYSGLFVEGLYPRISLPAPAFPPPLMGFFRALGAIFFLPYPLIGLALFLMLLSFSPILSLLAFLGYFSGTALAIFFTGSASQAFADPGHFNFILVALALGGVFLLPSRRSYLLALLGSAVAFPLTAASQVFWRKFGLPAFALPFNLTTVLFLYTLRLSGSRDLVSYYRGTPEKTLDYHLSLGKRFPTGVWDLELPVSGRWTVWQGPEGQFTHKGPWRQALDLAITDERGRTYRGEGMVLEDYYAYRKPIFSPITGRVITLVDGLPDEPPGSANTDQPWGNHLILYDPRGFYVVLAHFSPGTFRVKEGDWVVKGALLGLCGSSGYAPEPHLHLHVQLQPEIGAQSLPFVFRAYLSDGKFRDFSLPKEGETLEGLPPDKRIRHTMNFLLGEKLIYELLGDNQRLDEVEIRVEMAPDGTFYLTDGRARLYFALKTGAFYFLNFEGSRKSPLYYFLMAAPKIPLGLRPGLSWEDRLPLEIFFPAWRKNLELFLLSLWPQRWRPILRYQALSRLDFEGHLRCNEKTIYTRVRLAEDRGFEKIEMRLSQGYLCIRRLGYEKGV
ncbi:peptidoglycan DD-metalloendopeptidase family protein [Thermosulfurimonas marina]|uniref:Peptidoglycan DD-metalloendopeptidase family protein n=1 Tax=Thermosulfurimonas marina TaxID=2047767 RepID=A0A6H1WU54_9BACT|nr:urea transporter [Thermosulfurimonas marina]QJA06732.1 peptidoglycan DD-metalloendopeptidase family protein [Thermosulfurimonas marina]